MKRAKGRRAEIGTADKVMGGQVMSDLFDFSLK